MPERPAEESHLFPRNTDLRKTSELNLLAGSCLPKIAAAKGGKRRKLLCELACRLYDAWIEPRAKLCRSVEDVASFQKDLSLTLSVVVIPLLSDVKLRPDEFEAIELAAAGRRQHWTGMVIAEFPELAGDPLEEEKADGGTAVEGKTGETATGVADPVAQARRKRVDDYIAAAERQGVKVTRTMIWRKAGYQGRSEFERWERNDRRATATADKNIRRVLESRPPELLAAKTKR